VKTRKSLAYFSIHKSFFIHAYYQKKTSKPFFSRRKFTKPSLPLTFKNRTAQNASKNGVYKTPENYNQFSIDYNSQHPLD